MLHVISTDGTNENLLVENLLPGKFFFFFFH